VTQRGVDRRETFSADADRETYLQLIRLNLTDSGARVLGWCLMTNHVHLVVMPEREDSLAVLLRRVHGRYAQYYNARYGRSGHLWQNRYFACALGPGHLWAALETWNATRCGPGWWIGPAPIAGPAEWRTWKGAIRRAWLIWTGGRESTMEWSGGRSLAGREMSGPRR
jgi:REP element-mobilizing transposase RayT